MPTPPNFEMKLSSRRIPRPGLKPLASAEMHGVTPLAGRFSRRCRSARQAARRRFQVNAARSLSRYPLGALEKTDSFIRRVHRVMVTFRSAPAILNGPTLRHDMTDELRSLLHQYGLLYVTMSKLENDRPGRVHDTLDQYDASLGPVADDEPVVFVRISEGGEPRIVSADTASNIDEPYRHPNVTIMELPEDEFHFFRAFRAGLFELERVVPSFLFEMAIVYAYTLFESYLFEVVRRRYRAHPELMGANKQLLYSDVVQSVSKEDLIETIIGREVDRLMYEPLVAILDALRSRLGFRSLSTEFDFRVQVLSMIRNCIVHNRSRADSKLAALDSSFKVDQPIAVNFASFSVAVGTCRKLCAAIDTALENMG